MGRYYFGDIEGKFWFGVQDSDDATFFGVDPYPIIHESESDSESSDKESESSDKEPEYNEIAYDFEKEHIELVEKGIQKCKEELKDYKVKLDKFFDTRNSYNYEELRKELNLGYNSEKDEVHDILEWYARLLLGEKILTCLQEKGQCHFGCEL